MFENLATFKKILVTGPQRSGTTICHRMIVQDLQCSGFVGYDEDDFDVRNRDNFEQIYGRDERAIIHCPDLSYYIHYYGSLDTLVVWMLRDPEDVKRSQERIGWVKGFPIPSSFFDYGVTEENAFDTIATVKNAYWSDYQKPRVAHFLEIEYESLQTHPLWIDQGKRKGFATRQWRLG